MSDLPFIIGKPGVQRRVVFWQETQESPVAGYWVANIKKATRFSCHRRAKRYIRKYLVQPYWFEEPFVLDTSNETV